MNAIALTPSRLQMDPETANQFGIEKQQWRVLCEQIFPSAKTPESILMAVSYCKVRNLDVFKRPVHIVPIWSSEKNRMVETVWPGISEIRSTAARTGEYAGIDEIEHGPDQTRTFKGQVKTKNGWQDQSIELTFPKWTKATVYRIVKGNRVPFTARVEWLETYATSGKGELPNAMWQRRVYGQPAKCAEAAALRMAFPEEIGNEYSAEEMEGQTFFSHNHEPVEAKPELVAPPPPPSIEADILERAETAFAEINDVDELSDMMADFEGQIDSSKWGDLAALHQEHEQRIEAAK